jgi:hypothetical protein
MLSANNSDHNRSLERMEGEFDGTMGEFRPNTKRFVMSRAPCERRWHLSWPLPSGGI